MNYFRKILLTGISIIIAIPVLFSQTFFFDNYSVKNGLAQSNVYSIIQDKSGYVWMGTASGVSKFDGAEFINITTENGLAENGVRTIFEDSVGNLWFGHTGGKISFYDGKSFKELQLDTLISNADITSIVEDNNGQIWISSRGAGAILLQNPYADSLSEIKYKQFKGQEGLSDRIYKIVRLSNNNICFITDFGIKEFDGKKNTFDNFKLKGLSYFSQITSMYEDRNGNYWFGTYTNGLQKYDKKKNKFEFYFKEDEIADKFISTIYDDSHGNIWVGTWGGGITKITNGKFKKYNTQNGFPDNKIRVIFEDREGNILIGTNENGVAIYKGEQFVSFGENDGLVNEQVWAILKDSKKNYWFGTNAGITIYNPKSELEEKFTNFTKEQNIGLLTDQIRYIKEDKNKNIWIGTWGQGVFKYDEIKSKFEPNYMINDYAYPLSRGNISAMEIDKSNNMWIGTSDGLIYYEIDNEKIDRLSNVNGIAGNDISALFCDSKGIVWVGSRGKGLTAIDDDEISMIKLNKKFTPNSICEDKNGKIWIGTESQGVIVLDNKEIINQFKVKDGLSSDLITTISVDDNNNIYIGTNNGLNKYVQKENKFYTYTKKVGFIGIEVKRHASFKEKNGNIWVGTVKGVIKINPKEEVINILEPATHILRLRVNLKDREMIPDMKLNYTEKSIIFNFGSICITDQDKVEYQYMLEGADDDWRPITKQTEIIYSPLPPNYYTFKVKAKNNAGIWNKEPITYSFRIIPPFWQTWWFYLIVAVIGILIIYGFIKTRERNLIKEKAILEDKVEQRTIQISQKNLELAKKNKDITDSINYAQRIQSAIMHPEAELLKVLKKSFIYYQAKDIVSGDFYWFSEKENKKIIAAADCTGHGVPGAFMSMIGISFLNEIVNEKGIVNPDEILNKLREYIINVMQQTGDTEEAKDGMDIALLSIDNKNNVLEYAGAYNSLYLVRKNVAKSDIKIKEKYTFFENDLIEIKANRMPIGVSEKQLTPFSKVKINIQPNDCIYITTDGFIDQFGGELGKKFLSKQFKKLLISLQDKNESEHKSIFEKTFINWKGNYEQIDDVLVIGVKIV